MNPLRTFSDWVHRRLKPRVWHGLLLGLVMAAVYVRMALLKWGPVQAWTLGTLYFLGIAWICLSRVLRSDRR